MTADELKSMLLALRDRLGDQQESILSGALGDAGSRGVGKAPINLAEQASDEQEIDLMAGRLTSSSETLADVNDAIQRIDDGHFDECEECGGGIGERRLRIRPWARLCVECQRKNEAEGEF